MKWESKDVADKREDEISPMLGANVAMLIDSVKEDCEVKTVAAVGLVGGGKGLLEAWF